MKKTLNLLFLSLLSLSALLYLFPHLMRGHILRLSDGAVLTLEEIMDDLQEADLVFIGELHDQMSHHRAQLSVIEALHKKGVMVAVGLEMFEAGSQNLLDRWTDSEAGEDEFIKAYYENWNFPCLWIPTI